MYTKEVLLEWDEVKNKINQEKHGLHFEDSLHIFQSDILTLVDNRQNYGETRYITFGELMGRIIMIAHIYREDRIRIISMRKANESEKKRYQEQLEKNRFN